jgi:hypothetical protein
LITGEAYMSISTRVKGMFTKVKGMLTDDDSHDKHYAKDGQQSYKTSTNDHHHDDHDHEHSDDKKGKKHKEDMFDFFD